MASANPVPDLSVTSDPGKRDIYFGLTGFVVCAAFAALFARAVAAGDYGPHDDTSADVILLTGFGIGSIVTAVWTIHALLGRRKRLRTYRVEHGDVVCLDGRGLLWREPVETYQRIRWHDEQRSYAHRYGRQAYEVQVISLDHPQAERSFDIFEHQDSEQLHDRCRLWAETLGLPVLRQTAGQTDMETFDLDEPMISRAAEGHLEATTDASNETVRGIARWQDRDVVWFSVRPTSFYALFIAPALVLAGAATSFEAGSFVPGSGVVLTACVIVALTLILATLGFRQRIGISSSSLIALYRFAGLILVRRELPLDDIVRIHRGGGIGSDSVAVEGRTTSVRLLFLGRNTATGLATVLNGAIGAYLASNIGR